MPTEYSPDGIACGKCKFWYGGQCRRHPPQMVLYPADNQHPIMYTPIATWPDTAAGAWCGDFQSAI